MRICQKALAVSEQNGYYSIATNAVELRLWFVTEDILRIRAGFDGDWAEESYALTLTAWADRFDSLLAKERARVTPQKASLADFSDHFELKSSRLSVKVDKEPFKISVFDGDGELIHADIPDLSFHEDSNLRRIHFSQIDERDSFYGFGERSGELNKARQFMTMCPTDAMGYDARDTDGLYKHIPFYIKLDQKRRATGYFYNNPAECDFDMGRSHSNYWSHRSRYRVECGDIDLFLIAGPSINDVVRRYTDLTGKSALLPKYALGYLGSSMYYSELEKDCDDAIVSFIDAARRHDIPIDGFQLSSGYTVQGKKRCVFTWNYDRFKSPESFFARMTERGITVSPNVKPGILLEHPLMNEFLQKDMFVKASEGDSPAIGAWWGGKGRFVDFTNPQTRERWKEYLTANVLAKGAESVWNDNCEYESVVDKDSRVDFEGRGARLGAVRSEMCNLMCMTTKNAINEFAPNRRPFIVCRAGYSGIQRYAQTWAGDNFTSWRTLKNNIATILGMGLSGVANQGADIGGFAGPAPEPELFVRWVQNGIFQPRFSIHSTNTDNTVTEPWMYSGCTEFIRRAIKLRYRMFPYFYSLMYRAHTEGLPIMQPMIAAFQHDANCDSQSVDFMFGDGLLVANVVEKGAATRDVYLPTGCAFYDFESCERHEGGQTLTLPVSLGSIPMFLRSGAIVPFSAENIDSLHTAAVKSLKIYCVPDADGSFTLYEDDGLTNDFERGAFHKIVITMKTGRVVTLDFRREGDFASSLESIELCVLHPDQAPFSVSLGGAPLEHFLDRELYEAAPSGWYYSQTKRSVLARFPVPAGDFAASLDFGSMDLLGM